MLILSKKNRSPSKSSGRQNDVQNRPSGAKGLPKSIRGSHFLEVVEPTSDPDAPHVRQSAYFWMFFIHFVALLASCFEDFGNKSAENWQKTLRKQVIANALLETKRFDTTSAQQTANYKIGGRRCARRMAHGVKCSRDFRVGFSTPLRRGRRIYGLPPRPQISFWNCRIMRLWACKYLG